ncbi:MAG: hypothetical protein ASARMPRED_003334 [Alectoria sarmentosa]|nr:MAG: hypothetical protein ASARMPRED_003334 [Alectoria sarmentosa]
MVQLVSNEYSPEKTGYINKKDLERFLKEKFGSGIDFQLTTKNERWFFKAPRKVGKEELMKLVKIVK